MPDPDTGIAHPDQQRAAYLACLRRELSAYRDRPARAAAVRAELDRLGAPGEPPTAHAAEPAAPETTAQHAPHGQATPPRPRAAGRGRRTG